MRAPPVVRRLACAALGLAVLTTVGRAQQTRVLAPVADARPADSVHLALHDFAASRRPGGSGWVRLDIDNRHHAEVTVVLRLTSPDARRVELWRRSVVPATSRRSLELVYPRTGLPYDVSATLGNGATTRFPIGSGSGSGDVGALLVGAAPRLWADAVGRAFDRGGGAPSTTRPTTDPREIPPGWLPRTATALTGYDLVIADADQPQLDRDAWATLLQYARLGGRLVVDHAHAGADPGLDALAARSATPGAGLRQVRTGFGLVLLRGRELPDHLDDATVAALRPLLFAPSPWSVERMLQDDTAGPLPGRQYQRQLVAGVTSIPADTFLAIVLAFVIVVGPINHVFLRRRGQPWLVLFTVPLAGGLVTAVILIATAVVEGTGLRGVRDTLTVLDQPQHRATVHVRSTLFATVSPRRIAPRPGTWLSTSEVFRQSAAGADVERSFVWASAADDEHALSGALLPSRQPTTVASLSDGVARDRLRFRRRDGGRVELLEGTRLWPQRRVGAAVLRLPDGAHFAMAADGLLDPVSPARATALLRALLDTVTPPPAADTTVWTADGAVRPPDAPALTDRVDELPPGSYACALQQAPPTADTLGLDVRWTGGGEHVLVGLIDAEDLTR